MATESVFAVALEPSPLNVGFLAQGVGDLVLLADDDDLGRERMRRALEAAGLKVEEVTDGLELLDYLEDAERWDLWPDLVIVAAQMPGMDDERVAQRRRSWRAHVPLVVLAERYTEGRADLLPAWGDLVLPRPVSLCELVELATSMVI